MMSKRLIAIAGTVVLSQAGLTFATGPSHPDNSEAGSVYHGAEYRRVEGKLARADVWNTIASTDKPVSKVGPDRNWEFVGGESGWQLRQPTFEYRHGRLVRIDKTVK